MGKYYLNKLRQMGGKKSKPEPPKEPEQTVAEMVKEAKKGLDNMIRGFKREIMKIEMDAKQIKKDLEKAVKKGEPRTTQKIYATNYLKKQNMINIQKVVTEFQVASERQNIIGEMIEDATEMDDMEADDTAADDLINSIADKNRKPGEGLKEDDFEAQLNNLKS